jgi:hypothetical protein
MRLPVYEQQVRLQGRNRTDLSVRANPDAFGAQVGNAMQGLGAGIMDLAKAKQFKESLIADADARAGLNELIDYDRELKYDPVSGALVQTGANGMTENREAAEAKLRERRAAIEEKLGPQARKIFAQAADTLEDATADDLIKHDAEQTRNYVNEQGQATAENFMQMAMDHYGDDAKWDTYTRGALAEIEQIGRLNGKSDAQIAVMKEEALRAAHGNRAVRIAYDDPIKADAYLDEHKGELGEAEYSRLKTGMEAAVVESKADAAIDDLRGSDAYVGTRATNEDAWLTYSYGDNTVRNKPISGRLKSSMSFLRDMGITMEVFSGGQDGKGEGDQRTGSTRHDHGDAADVFFYKDGRKLDWNNPDDLPYFNEIVARAKAAGVTGFGAGDGYMAGGSVHLGFGNAGVWGDEGKGSAAALWLVQAYAGAALGTTPTGEGDVPVDSGVSTRSAYEAVMAIEDPKVRKAALAKLDAQLTLEASLAAQDQKAAGDEAWSAFLQGGMAPQDLPMDLQIKMGREATLNFFESARAYEAGTLVTDDELYSELQRMSVMDEKKFSELILNDYRMDFSKADFRTLETMQNGVIQQMQEREANGITAINDPATMQEVVTKAEAAYAGASLPGKDPVMTTRFRDQVTSYARDFMKENGRPMTGPEMETLFSMLITPILVDNPNDWSSPRNARAFEAPYRSRDETKVTGGITVEDMTLADEELARAELLSFSGVEPGEDEIVQHHNRKVLAAVGVNPDMMYSDIPKAAWSKLTARYPEASNEELLYMYIDFVLETSQKQ